MFKLILTSLSLVCVSTVFSQSGFSSAVPYTYGEPFANRAYKEKADNAVEGNPMLFDDWKRGEVVLKNGEKYSVDKINLNADLHKFLYSQHDTVFEFVDNVKQITIYNNGSSDNFNSVMVFKNNVDPESDNFVELLDTGKITIFQTYEKKPEGENYSNGIVNNSRKYVLHTTQYALINKVATPIKFNSSTLNDLTADKKKQVEDFIKENKLKVKKEPDFLKAINYYNSLSS